MKEDGLTLIHQIRVSPDRSRSAAVNAQRMNTDHSYTCRCISLSQEAEKRGVSPEEVYAALCVCSGSNVNPCDWLASELPHLLDEICAMAASVQLNCEEGEQRSAERPGPLGPAGEGVKITRAEAKLAWLAAGGDTDRAVRQLLTGRQLKVRRGTAHRHWKRKFLSGFGTFTLIVMKSEL